MPDVVLEMEIEAPLDRVWNAIVHLDRHVDALETVRSITILAAPEPGVRRAAWSISLQGAILQWEQDERIDEDAHVLAFTQVSGDMEVLSGAWTVAPAGLGRTAVRLAVEFEIGVPLVADMLNPVAQRSLRESCRAMLLGIEREAAEEPSWR